eukprot:Hpha_TRINITY_DN4988_c0_g1::TRINITY_DN4988_c0_g1_i1::g.51299::m.51299
MTNKTVSLTRGASGQRLTSSRRSSGSTPDEDAASRLAYRTLASQAAAKSAPQHSIDSDPLRKKPAPKGPDYVEEALALSQVKALGGGLRGSFRKYGALPTRPGPLASRLGGSGDTSTTQQARQGDSATEWSTTTGGLTDEATPTERPGTGNAPVSARTRTPEEEACGSRGVTPGRPAVRAADLPANALRRIASLASSSPADLLCIAQVCERWRRVCQQHVPLWRELPKSEGGPVGVPPSLGWVAADAEQTPSRHPLAALRRGQEPLRRAQLRDTKATANCNVLHATLIPVANSAVLQVVACADAKGEVTLRDPVELHVLASATPHRDAVSALSIQDRGRSRWLLTASGCEVTVSEVPKLGGAACMAVSRRTGLTDWGRVPLSLSIVRTLSHDSAVVCVCGHPSRPLVAAGCTDRSAVVWDVGGGAKGSTCILRRHTMALSAVAAVSNSVLATAGRDGLCCLWSWEGTLLRELTGHRGPVCGIAVSAGASASRGGYQSASAATARPTSAAGRHLVSVCGGGALRWAAVPSGSGGTGCSDPPLGEGTPTPTCLGAGGGVVCVGAIDGSMALVRLSDGHMATLTGHQGAVRCLFVDPTQQWIASGGDDGAVLLWSYARWDSDRAVKEIRPANVVCSEGADVAALSVHSDRHGAWQHVIYTTVDRAMHSVAVQLNH